MSQPMYATIDAAAAVIAQGKIVILADTSQPDGEGALLMAAEFATAEAVNFMAGQGRGLICASMPARRLAELRIDNIGKALHVGVDYVDGRTTTISAARRAQTLRALAKPDSPAEDFSRPGNVFPMASREGGVLEEPAHAEAALDLVLHAGLSPAAVICKIADEQGEPARPSTLWRLACGHRLLFVSISDLIAYRWEHEQVLTRTATTTLPLRQGTFSAIGYQDDGSDMEHVALTFGTLDGRDSVPVSIHYECVAADVFRTLECDCGRHLERSLERIVESNRGVLVYVRCDRQMTLEHWRWSGGCTGQLSTRQADHPERLGHRIAAQILRDLGIRRVSAVGWPELRETPALQS